SPSNVPERALTGAAMSAQIVQKIPCSKCGAMILPATAEKTGGLCMPCTREPGSFSPPPALGALIEEPDQTYLAETDTDGALRSLQAASCTYRIALGPRAGQKILSLTGVPSVARVSLPELRVNAHGFSLHAAVRWRADQRKELEERCRYITRPAIANERLKRNRAGQVVLQLKSPYKDGTAHIVMEPVEFMERLAALVPRPRLHLIRFHGVLAPTRSCAVKSFPLPQSVPPNPRPITPLPRAKHRA